MNHVLDMHLTFISLILKVIRVLLLDEKLTQKIYVEYSV